VEKMINDNKETMNNLYERDKNNKYKGNIGFKEEFIRVKKLKELLSPTTGEEKEK
jgi:hypothetical protein